MIKQHWQIFKKKSGNRAIEAEQSKISPVKHDNSASDFLEDPKGSKNSPASESCPPEDRCNRRVIAQ